MVRIFEFDNNIRKYIQTILPSFFQPKETTCHIYVYGEVNTT